METTWYLDEDGFRVEIGTVVQFTEFCDDPDNPCKYYVIREMPNRANTLILSECGIDDKGHAIDIQDEPRIEVEPYKVGAI